MPKVIQLVYGRAGKHSHESKETWIWKFIKAPFVIIKRMREVTTPSIKRKEK